MRLSVQDSAKLIFKRHLRIWICQTEEKNTHNKAYIKSFVDKSELWETQQYVKNDPSQKFCWLCDIQQFGKAYWNK
jgi:hypothetical protein